MAKMEIQTNKLKKEGLLKVTINSNKKIMTVKMKVNLREPLFSLFDGTSAKIPLDLFENHPLAYIPPDAPTALWL